MTNDRPRCGHREDPDGRDRHSVQLGETGFCEERAAYQIGEPRWINPNASHRESIMTVLACEEHIEAAKEYWRRRERGEPDANPTVTPLHLVW